MTSLFSDYPAKRGRPRAVDVPARFRNSELSSSDVRASARRQAQTGAIADRRPPRRGGHADRRSESSSRLAGCGNGTRFRPKLVSPIMKRCRREFTNPTTAGGGVWLGLTVSKCLPAGPLFAVGSLESAAPHLSKTYPAYNSTPGTLTCARDLIPGPRAALDHPKSTVQPDLRTPLRCL
jgi:hypothetical protein